MHASQTLKVDPARLAPTPSIWRQHGPRALPGLVCMLIPFMLGRYGTLGGTATLLSVIGAGLAWWFAFVSVDRRPSPTQFVIRSACALLGILLLWVGAYSSAIGIGGYLFSLDHNTRYTAGIEVLVAVICAGISPFLLTVKGCEWLGWSRQTARFMYFYWLSFYPLAAMVVTVRYLLAKLLF